MPEKRLYIPTDYISPHIKDPVIFLAGPIQGAENWQNKAADLIHNSDPTIIVASPRRDYLPGSFNYQEQVDWETFHLRRAGENGAVLFWLAKENNHNCDRAYAQTTRAELFEWKVRHERDGANLVIGIEDGFSGAKYVRHRFSQDSPEVPIYDRLEATCLKAVDLAK